jgi:manganese efflux pump family protein
MVLALLLVALGLGLDNLAAAVGIGMSGASPAARLRVAVVFGLFEGGMPVLGVLLGHGLTADLGSAARWAGSGLLIATGCYALAQAARRLRAGRHPAACSPRRLLPGRPATGRLLITGTALSIDNLAVGFALGTRHIGLALAAVVIGVVSVGLSLAGLELGGRLGAAAGQYGELLSGLILVGLGVALGCDAL